MITAVSAMTVIIAFLLVVVVAQRAEITAASEGEEQALRREAEALCRVAELEQRELESSADLDRLAAVVSGILSGTPPCSCPADDGKKRTH